MKRRLKPEGAAVKGHPRPNLENKIILQKRIILAAMEKSLGVVTTACKASGIARATFYFWMQEDEDFKKKVKDIADIALDFAESNLFQAIQSKSMGAVTATIFYLKCKGKGRGYIDRTEFSGPDGNPIDINVKSADAARILEMALKTLK